MAFAQIGTLVDQSDGVVQERFIGIARVPVAVRAAFGQREETTASVQRTDWESQYIRRLVLWDLVLGAVAALLAIEFTLDGAYVRFTPLWCSIPPILVICLVATRAYDRRYLFVGNDEYQRVLHAGIILAVAIGLGSYAFNLDVARGYIIVAVPTATLLGIFSRHLHRRQLHRAWAKGQCLRRVVVVGHESSVVALTRQLRHERFHGLGVVAACVPRLSAESPLTQLGIMVYATLDEIPTVVREAGADTVVVLSCPELEGPQLRRLAWHLERYQADLMVAGALIDVANSRTTIRPVDGLPMLHLDHPRFSGARRLIKDGVDRVGAAIGLVLTSPILLVCALAIRFGHDSPGPVFFRQARIGQNGQSFTMLKLRTMYVDAEARLAQVAHLNNSDGVLFKMRHDPRVTRIGRILRRFSVDELPQLINVLRGDMSLVGPRPPLKTEVDQYPADMHRRLVVKPGLTGLWQVSGRSDLSWEDSMRLDLRYVENWSLTLDLVILLRTVTVVLRTSGAY